jgi:hypothetical protein
LIVALAIPAKYSITSTIGIGQTIQDDKVILLESPETVKAKLEYALVPKILNQYEDEAIRLTEFEVSIPKNSDLVLIKTKVKEEEIGQFKKIITEMTDAIETDHERVLMPVRARIKADIMQKELELKRENDQRFYEPIIKDMESQLKEAEISLEKLEDPTIQGYRRKALEIQLENEKNQLASLKERESILKASKGRLDRLSDLLIYQISELKEQIKGAIKLQQESVTATKTGAQGMAMLMIDNELQQNRTRLGSLEERLYIDLENQHSELQKEINDITRQRAHQHVVIEEKEKNLEKYQVENKQDVEKQKTEIAKIAAQKMKIPADREQKIESIQQQIADLNEQLSNIIDTRTITQPMRSKKTTGTSKRLIVVLAAVLGVMLGLFSVFFAEFRDKVRSQQLEG